MEGLHPSGRTRLDAGFVVDVPPDVALERFTPEGERDWVPGWHPEYPGGRPEEPVPGTVFVTRSASTRTTWVVVEREPDRMRYARVAEGRTAGTVTVVCAPATRTTTDVRVVYDLTALSPEGRRDVADLAADYPAHLEGWRQAIEAAGTAGRAGVGASGRA
ncbi:SRPBCC family protein [Egicoccus sp. AB-alg2]|uniref:SRPBCC family protein n=1 Tax=Egicoccus sp. AB-alg2 TaxID=3242693 RepID=UPI00359EDB1F